jgi:hypothetical protein
VKDVATLQENDRLPNIDSVTPSDAANRPLRLKPTSKAKPSSEDSHKHKDEHEKRDEHWQR